MNGCTTGETLRQPPKQEGWGHWYLFPPLSLLADFLLLSFFILVLINISIDNMMRHLDATEVVVQMLQDSTSTWAQCGEHTGDSRRQGVTPAELGGPVEGPDPSAGSASAPSRGARRKRVSTARDLHNDLQQAECFRPNSQKQTPRGLVGGPVLTETSAAELDLWHLLHRLPELAGEPVVPEHQRQTWDGLEMLWRTRCCLQHHSAGSVWWWVSEGLGKHS